MHLKRKLIEIAEIESNKHLRKTKKLVMKSHNLKYIVVEGPIGVGKTSLAQRLSDEFDKNAPETDYHLRVLTIR